MGNRFVPRYFPGVKVPLSGMINTYREIEMKSFLLMTGSGPLVILTSYSFIEDTTLLEALQLKGIDKFIAYEVPIELAMDRYGGHFTAVMNDWLETDDLRVLDFNGERVFGLFNFSELGEAHIHEP